MHSPTCTSHKAPQKSSFAQRLFNAGDFPAGWVLPKILCAVKKTNPAGWSLRWTERVLDAAGMLKGSSVFNPQKLVFLYDTWPHARTQLQEAAANPKYHIWFYFSFLDALLGLEQPQGQNKEGPGPPQPVPSKPGFVSSTAAHLKILHRKD